MHQYSEVLYTVFILCQVETKFQTLAKMKLFQKTKIYLELVSLPYFLYEF